MNPETSTPTVYRIPEPNLEPLRARIVKMNRRAVRLGMEPLVLAETGEDFDILAPRDNMFDEAELGYNAGKWAKIDRQPGESIEAAQARYLASPLMRGVRVAFSLRRFVLCTVTGSLPRVNGWAMRATIQHEDGGNILRTVPGFDENLPQQYRTASTACEHCNQNRRRNDTYVLEHEDGTWKQVGRNCLADFIRSTNAGAWAEAAEMLASLRDDLGSYEEEPESWGGGGGGTRFFSAAAILTQVACCVRNDGWCSRTEARNSFAAKQATVDHALIFFDSKALQYMSQRDKEKYEPKPADAEKAEAAIAWAQALASDVTNDYLWNIRVVSNREFITHREAGLAGSIVAAYTRHLEQELKRAYERQTTLDEHFGEVGKRDVFTLTVMGAKSLESDYGLTTLYTFRDPEGRAAKWFASGDGGNLDIGSTYRVKASIKAHDVYQERKQTVLTRASVLCNLTALDQCVTGEHEWIDGYRAENLHTTRFCLNCGECELPEANGVAA